MTIHKHTKNIKSLNPVPMLPDHKTIHDIAVEVQTLAEFVDYMIRIYGTHWQQLKPYVKEFTSKRIQHELNKEPSHGNNN